MSIILKIPTYKVGQLFWEKTLSTRVFFFINYYQIADFKRKNRTVIVRYSEEIL